jgi:hypothetical protein
MTTPGISPLLLVEQIANTAPWAAEVAPEAARVLSRAAEIDARRAHDAFDPQYLHILLAAHYLTVATFVPTDVDTRIRHHHWQGLEADRLAAACAVVDEVASWEPSAVSERVVRAQDERGISGHDGEWLGVRAGALGRALMVGAGEIARGLLERIEAELEREARAFSLVVAEPRPLDVLRAATVLAHNAGDLSRVVEGWPDRPELRATRARLVRLGHEGADRYGGAFVRAGAINKAATAIENHRFLALRKPRVLRRSRALLLPIGPFFDAWGTRVATELAGDEEGLASVVDALVQTHQQGPAQQGCLRALAGIHATAQGGVDALAPALPARVRKLLRGGPIRDALRTPRAQFEARMVHRARALVSSIA